MKKDLKKLNMTDVDYIHVDYMDGKFVPNQSFSFRKLKKLYKYTAKRLDVHLMVKSPEKLIRKFAKLNAEYLTIHVEISKNVERLLDLIHSYGMKAGLALNPETSIEAVKPYLDKIDLILVMSVHPGQGGQVFIEDTEKKVQTLRAFLKESKKENVLIAVDGGINLDTKEKVKEADILVSGSYITGSVDFQERITSLR